MLVGSDVSEKLAYVCLVWYPVSFLVICECSPVLLKCKCFVFMMVISDTVVISGEDVVAVLYLALLLVCLC